MQDYEPSGDPDERPTGPYHEAAKFFASPEGAAWRRAVRRRHREEARQEWGAEMKMLTTGLLNEAEAKGIKRTVGQAAREACEILEHVRPELFVRAGLRRVERPVQRVKTPPRRQTFCPPRTITPTTRTRGRRESAPRPSAKRTASQSSDEGPGEPPDGRSDDDRRWSS